MEERRESNGENEKEDGGREERGGRVLEMEKQGGQGMNRRGKVDMWRYLALAPSK